MFTFRNFVECDSDEDEDFKQQDRELKASIPFAVVGSNTIIEVAGKKVRGRQYPWGVVDGNKQKVKQSMWLWAKKTKKKFDFS